MSLLFLYILTHRVLLYFRMIFWLCRLYQTQNDEILHNECFVFLLEWKGLHDRELQTLMVYIFMISNIRIIRDRQEFLDSIFILSLPTVYIDDKYIEIVPMPLLTLFSSDIIGVNYSPETLRRERLYIFDIYKHWWTEQKWLNLWMIYFPQAWIIQSRNGFELIFHLQDLRMNIHLLQQAL